MRKIYTDFDNVSVPSESGSPEYDVYERYVDGKTGEVSLRVVKKLNRYNEIQEAAVGVTLNELISKYETGEIMDFNFKQGQYLDLTQFPSSAIEALNLLKNVDNLDILNDYLRTLNSDDKEEKLNNVNENSLEGNNEDEKE